MSHHSSSRSWQARSGLALLMLAVAAGTGAGQAPAATSATPAAQATAHAQAAAAAQAASLDDILKQIATYDGGIESAAFWRLRDYVQARKGDPAARAECETKLLAFLKTRATAVAKMAAARHLRVIAGDSAVPAFKAMLVADRDADLAIYVLQQLPGAAADQALIEAVAVPKLSVPTRIAIVAALGERRTPNAVPALVPLLKQPPLARPAVTALGAIGDPAATGMLTGMLPEADAALKPVVAASLLRCAERAVATSNPAAAMSVYEKLAADSSLPISVRKAAMMGKVAAAGSGGSAIVLEQLRGSDPQMHEAAIATVRDAFTPEAIAPVCEMLPRLPEASQVKLMAVLSGYPRDRVLPAILERARANALPVRMAALKALGSVGDASVVALLAEKGGSALGAEQMAARAALYTLKGRPVDEAIIALMAKKPAGNVQAELLMAVADRRIFAAKALVSEAMSASAQKTQIQALKAMRAIGTQSDIPAVLDLLVKTEDEAVLNEAEQATAALAQKRANADGRAGIVRGRLSAAKDAKIRARLIAVLPLVGDNSTLPLLRTLLNDTQAEVSDGAARALSEWPNGAALEDVMALARDSRNERHRLLAIRGLVRIVSLDRHRRPEAAIADLAQAASFSWRPEEQKLVLGALVQFPCEAALELAKSYLREPAVTAEAQAAINKLKPRLEALRKS